MLLSNNFKDNIKNYPYQLLNPVTDLEGNPMPAGAIGYTKPPSIAPALGALLQLTEEDMKDFFYPFTVAYPFKRGDSNGDVMDVPICKRIIHNHCGIVNVRKEDENNLWIDISLPLEK